MAGEKRTRDKIVAAAVALLGRDGPDGFSAATLAREAGTSKANVFHHFPVLDEIPLAAFDAFAAQMLAPMSNGSLSVRDRLAELGQSARRLVRDQRGFLNAYFVFFGKSLFEPRMRDRMQKTFAPFLAAIAAELEDDYPPAEAKVVARLVAMILDGLALHLLTFDDEAEIVAAWQRFLDIAFPESGDGRAA